jgi:hypothetical protein
MTSERSSGKARQQSAFDYSLDFDAIDFRERPDLYRVGKGQQGVLLVEPYRSELLPHWRFRTPDIARTSAERLYECFLDYNASGDFVGMDMARKFPQMGFTRARRYANHTSGRKWSPDRSEVLSREVNPVKAESAAVFCTFCRKAAEDPDYLERKAMHIAAHPGKDAP